MKGGAKMDVFEQSVCWVAINLFLFIADFSRCHSNNRHESISAPVTMNLNLLIVSCFLDREHHF